MKTFLKIFLALALFLYCKPGVAYGQLDQPLIWDESRPFNISVSTSSVTTTVESKVFVRSPGSEAILNYKIGIEVLPSSDLNITESIAYDFGINQRHGIYREIPYKVNLDDDKKGILDMKVSSVKDETSANYKFSLSKESDNLKIKIGDPNKLITGQKTYIISYVVSGAIRYFSDHDELYWNATGTSWPVPIDKVSVNVKIPAQGQIEKAICYSGAAYSTAQVCQAQKQGNQANFSAANLGSLEGLTIAAAFPKNIVAVRLPKEDKPGLIEQMLPVIFGIGSIFWFIIAPFWVIYNWLRFGRDPQTNPNIPVWYEPPKNKQGEKIKPAEVGTLFDETADNRDISATIVDLAIKGYLKIKEKKKNEYTLIKVKEFGDDPSLADFEKDILKGIFKSANETTTMKLSGSFYSTANKVKNDLYQKVVRGGFFDQNPQSTRTKYYALATLALFTANFFLALVSFVFGKNMPKKTLFGTKANVVALGIKKFLTSQERQLEFQAKNWYFFEKLLPLAIVFGVEKIWAERFKDIAVEPPSWYEGSSWQTFNTLNFVNSLNQSTHAMAAAASPPTSSYSSSGFSGGFSGGGGGGGGGGSW
jgi:hypothetical protein